MILIQLESIWRGLIILLLILILVLISLTWMICPQRDSGILGPIKEGGGGVVAGDNKSRLDRTVVNLDGWMTFLIQRYVLKLLAFRIIVHCGECFS